MTCSRILKSKKTGWAAIAGFLIAGILLLRPLNQAVFSVRLGLSMKELASGGKGEGLNVEEATLARREGSVEYAALLYRPQKSSIAGAVVIVPGISELGCYHPKLVAVSRHFAERGFLVITPDIREFRSFQITAEPIEQILFWYHQASALVRGGTSGKTGLAGISYSGTLALMAAAKPEIRDRVGFVLALGPYSNLVRCTRQWFSASQAAVGEEKNHATLYARWVAMLSAVEMLPADRDRVRLETLLKKLLLEQAAPLPDADLSPEGLRWYRLATMPADQSDPALALKIEQFLVESIYPQLDPSDAVKEIHCPVYLIHGAYDALISPGESVELHRLIPHSHLLISPFLTHTHLNPDSLSMKQKARAVFNMLAFFYKFSRVVQ